MHPHPRLSHRAASILLLATLVALGCSGEGGPDAAPEEVLQLNATGTAYLGQQKWEEAKQAFQKALEQRPDDPLLLTNLAIARLQSGETAPAVQSLERALALDPDHAPAHYNLGLIHYRDGKFAEAAQHFEAVARSDPDDLFTQYFLGSVLSRIGREQEAERAFRAALARDPTHVSTLYGLGRLLLQSGRREEGERLVMRSQEVRARSGLDVAVGNQYGEQGPYSMGLDYPGDALAAPSAIPVSYRAVARAGVEGPASWTLRRADAGRGELVFARGGNVLALEAGGASKPVGPEAPGGAVVRALAAGDVDNDGKLELVALLVDPAGTLRPALLAAGEAGALAWRTDEAFPAPAAERTGPLAGIDLTLVDRDHDGDLDAFWCWSDAGDGAASCRLATNDASGHFATQASPALGFTPRGGAAGPVSVALSDTDNDRDVDLLFAGPAGVQLFSNQRDGSFQDISPAAGLEGTGGVKSLAVADLNKDGWMDLVIAGGDGATILRNRGGRFEPPAELPGSPAAPIVVLDFDNDGFLDLAEAGTGTPSLRRNLGAGRWSEPARADAGGGAAAPLVALDADGDGDLDLAALLAGEIVLLANEGGNARRFIDLDSRGVGDNRFGIGAKVEVLAGGLRQKFEVTRPLPLHVGLGERETVQSARYLWPSGVLQDEIGLAAGRAVEVAQLDRKGTSCPLLYARRGGRWQFVTDFLGGCAIGYRHAPNVLSVPDTDEYVRIEGGLEEDARGRLALRVNNQLEEVIWFDQIELVVVDHPSGTVVYPNERLMPGPPWPDFELFASSDVRPVAAAHGVESGLDLTETLGAADRRFVEDFDLLRFKGYALPHGLELDLGSFDRRERVVLLLDGWIDYADSTANVAAAQAGVELSAPRLWVSDGRAGWREARGVMGFPAGLPKTMAVELTGRFPTSDHRVRIDTNMRIYWDRARVLIGGERTPLDVKRLAPLASELRFGGYPRATSPDGKKPFAYDPEDAAPGSSWKAHVGAYTPFGDVTELLHDVDDRFVTTRHGDEIVVEFPSPGAPARGRERTFLLYADGFGKDMDPNSAASEQVGPIPFHGMPVYPYPPETVAPQRADEGTGSRPPRLVTPSSAGWPGASPQAAVEADLIFRGGTVVDGTGAAPRRADVAIRDGRILAVGPLEGLSASRVIDASGLVVAPGFIDLHSHADLILLADRTTQERLLAAKIRQGVTTVLVGNCGLGIAPSTPVAAQTLAAVNGWMTPAGVTAGTLSVADYLGRLGAGGIALNAGSLVPHGPVRISAMGLVPGVATPSQLETMRHAVGRALDEGAFGLSAGLIYPPGMFSDTAELVELAREVAARDRLFTCHVRGSSETLLPATRELIEIARRSGARAHHSHLEAVGERFWPRIHEVLALEDAARDEGLSISHDVFPYTRAATMMSAIYPPWALEGGVDGLLDRLRNPATRQRVQQEIERRQPTWPPWEPGGWPHNLVGSVGWNGIVVASVGPDGRSGLVGRSLAAIAREDGRDPFDVVSDLMLTEHGRVGQQVDEISGSGERIESLLAILSHPSAAVISDAEDYGAGAPHPAHAGAFVRALRLVRERLKVPLEEIVRRMTGYPATLAGLVDRGVLRPGTWADIVVFDPAAVTDRATWDAPRRPAEGVSWVVLNGSIVVEGDRYLGGLHGRVLRAGERSACRP